MSKQFTSAKRQTVPPPKPEISSALYAIADIMADAPMDAAGLHRMSVEALVMALVGKGTETLIARNAIEWALKQQCLRYHSRRGEYPKVLQDTITLRQIGNGEYAKFLGARPRKAKGAGELVRSADDNSAWVKAITLWKGRFDNYKTELMPFRKLHPEMFRNPSRNILEIHSVMWAKYWDKQHKGTFQNLDDADAKPITPDELSESFIDGAEKLYKDVFQKKKTGKK
jgi:hypothetical protein